MSIENIYWIGIKSCKTSQNYYKRSKSTITDIFKPYLLDLKKDFVWKIWGKINLKSFWVLIFSLIY